MIDEPPEDAEGDRPDIIETSIGERSLSVEEASGNAVGDDRETVDTSPSTAPRGASTLPKIVGRQRLRPQLPSDCQTTLSYNCATNPRPTVSDRSTNCANDCHTMVRDNRARGLWLRGSVYIPATVGQMSALEPKADVPRRRGHRLRLFRVDH